MAISAYNGQFLERIGATELSRVSQITPGLTIQLQDRLQPGISVRGITSDDPTPGTDQRVALFQDGAPITQIVSAYAEMFDVDRIEIEKGPQSTLHGRSALNGGVSIYQRMPTNEFGVELKAGAGQYDQRLIQGVVNIPVSEIFAIRAGALVRKQDGFLRDVQGGSGYNSVDTQAYRLTARFDPSSSFSFDFAGTYDVDDTDSGGAFKSRIFTPRDQTTGAVIGDTRFWTPTHIGTFGTLPDAYSHREIIGLSGTARLRLNDDLDITSISGYRWWDGCQAGDLDGTTMDIVAYEQCNTGETYSQEVRLNIRRGEFFEGFVGASGLWLNNDLSTALGSSERAMYLQFAGALLSRAPNGLTNTQINAAVNAMPIGALMKPFHLDYRVQGAETETYDLFADGTFHLSDRLEAFVGGRVTQDSKDVTLQITTPLGGSVIRGGGGLLMTRTPDGRVVTGEHSSSQTTGRAGVRYELTAKVNVYAVYGIGKRPEIIALDPSGTSSILPSEELASVEAGIKFRLFGGDLVGDASVYRFDYSNFQTMRREEGVLVPFNAGGAIANGFETQATWRLADGLSVFGSYGYNDARFQDGAYEGNSFRNSPDHKFAFGVNATVPTPFGELNISPVYSWQSKIFFSDDNDRSDLQVRSPAALSDTTVDEFQDGFGLLSAKVNFQPRSGPWSLAVIGENLLDTKYITDAGNAGDLFGLPTFVMGTRRNVRLEASVKF